MNSKEELEKIRKKIYERYTTTTKTGKVSTIKAMHLYRFVAVCLSEESLELMKKVDKKPTQRRLKQLKELGFDETYLSELRQARKKEFSKNEQIIVVVQNRV